MSEPIAEPAEIVFLGLGGTIQCAAGADGALPSLDPGRLVSDPRTVPAGIRVSSIPRTQVPSAALDLVDLHRVVDAAGRRLDGGATGVVVGMGTDMLEEAAFALDLLWARPEPLVVTAAMRMPGRAGADGGANLRAALQVAADPQARDLGCLVVMNDEVHAAWQVRKVHTSLPSAFRSMQSGPLGGLVEDRLRLVALPMDRPTVHLPAGAGFPPVALLRSSIGDDGRLLRGLVEAGFAGVVIEAAGGGSVPPAWSEPLGAVAACIPAVYASRTAGGATLVDTYGGAGSERDLVARGLVPAGTLDGLKARVLLRLLLAAGADQDWIRDAFSAFDRPAHSVARARGRR